MVRPVVEVYPRSDLLWPKARRTRTKATTGAQDDRSEVD
jgi:hypothetical protein